MRRMLPGAFVAVALSAHGWAQPVPRGPEFQVNVYTTGEQFAPSVAAGATGSFVVVWTTSDQDGSAYGIFGRLHDDAGTPLGGEFQVNVYTTGSQAYPSLATDAGGGFIVVWFGLYQDGSGSGIFGRRFDSAGDPVGGDFQVNTYTTGDQFRPSVAADAAGGFVVVWGSQGQDGDGYGVMGRLYDSTGMPSGGEFQINSYTTAGQFEPAAAMDSSGGFVVVWRSDGQDGSGSGVLGRRFDSTGDPEGSEFIVNAHTANDQFRPAIAMNSSGNFVVAWQSNGQDGSYYGVFGQRFDSSGFPMGGEFQVNTYTTSHQSRPSVAMGPSGSFVVNWDSYAQDGSGYGVFSRWYDSSGAPLGGDLQVNTYTTANQLLPSVEVDALGRAVLVWFTYGQDGSGAGILGRGYCEDLDADSLCDGEDVIVTSPLDGAMLDCSDPKFVRPTITWQAGNYDRFRVYVASDPGFVKGTRVTSGDGLLRGTSWIPSGKKWRNACNKALAADPNSPVLFVEVFGVDVDLPKKDAFRTTLSQAVQGTVQF